jgi:outer membrane protein TolC
MQYQQHLADSAPPARVEGDPYRAVPGTTGPALQLLTDEQTGRRYLPLALNEALYRALANDPNVHVVSYDPAVAYEDFIKAEAAFDWIIDANTSYNRLREANRALRTPLQTEEFPVEIGAIKPLVTGGQFEVDYKYDHRLENYPVGVLSPSSEHDIIAQLTQPLLRNAGPEVNLANVHVSKLNYAIAEDKFRSAILDEILQIQTLYWQLVQARENYQIQLELVHVTEQLYERILARGPLDASRVQIAQAIAAVETRRAALVQAMRNIGDIQDQLTSRMADASIPLPADVAIVPTTPASTQRVVIDAADQLAVALKYSPELAEARKAIEVNHINVMVARNQELPRLDFTGGLQFQGFDQHIGESFEKMWQFDFINYNLGLAFQYPLGNRAAVAVRKSALYNLDRSIAAMQGTADQVALAIRSSIRQVNAGYDAIQINEQALRASIESRDALDARLQIMGQLTPETLQLQLTAQEGVAAAQQALVQAQTDYNVGLASLARATGTSIRQAGIRINESGQDYVRQLTDRVKTQAADQPAVPPAGAPSPATVAPPYHRPWYLLPAPLAP